jgi:hypothetical protein
LTVCAPEDVVPATDIQLITKHDTNIILIISFCKRNIL